MKLVDSKLGQEWAAQIERHGQALEDNWAALETSSTTSKS